MGRAQRIGVVVAIAYTAVAVFLAFALAGSGIAKLRRDARVTASLMAAGVPLDWFPPLAALEIAAAVGLLAGILFRPLGVVAAVGVVLYFAGALGFHLRAHDVRGLPLPGALLVAGVVAVVTGLATM